MTGDDLERRIRAGLADAAADVEPAGTLAGLRARIEREHAEEWTQAQAQVIGGSWRMIKLAVALGVPRALDMTTEEWVRQRLGGYIRLEIEERRDAARQLTRDGHTQQETADILGVGVGTVNRDVAEGRPPAPVPNGTPGPPSRPADQDKPPAPVPNGTPPPEPAEPEPERAPGAHVGRNSGDNDWYTPGQFTEAAATVMGAIDLDPASSDAANEVIGAAEFYTADDDGLTQPWAGRVWMNPPYAQPLIDRFCTRLAREYQNGAVTEACVLVNNATETGWFQEVLTTASAVCFPRGRIRFWHPARQGAAPLQGQAVIYLGGNPAGFRDAFVRFGPVGVFPR